MLASKHVFTILAVAAVIGGCQNYDYQKTREGLIYKIVSDGKGQQVKPGQFLKVHYDAVIGDSVLFSTYERMPVYGRYDTLPQAAYDFLDFMGQMKVGDSAIYIRSVDSLVARGFMQYDGVFKKGATIKGHLRILEAFESDTAVQADQKLELERETAREVASLEKFLRDNKIEGFQKAGSGVFVVMDRAGEGATIDSGQVAVVNYTGRLRNGTVFDSNTDSSFGHVEPFEFQVGTRQVITGWDEGMRLFRKGSKGRMYIPAMLGYGMQPQGDRLPAYSDLIFDIEVLDVKPGQPQAPRP